MQKLPKNNIHNRIKKRPDTPMQEKLQADTDKYVSERLGKDHYSSRQELTDKGGRKLFTNDTKDTSDVALEQMFVGIAPEDTDT